MTTSSALTSIPTAAQLRSFAEKTDELVNTLGRVISGKPEAIETTVAVLLARGHLLLEDVPGVGKTTLATSLAKALDLSTSRIQFTPDSLPSDLTGVNVYHLQSAKFEFRPGPLFAHVVIGDEVNRASPKTQAALLECMAERQVTVDGTTHRLPEPFFVIATQNPIEMEGTYPLPEAQRDRFMARIELGYPSAEAEKAMLDIHASSTPFRIKPVLNASDVITLSAIAANVFTSDLLKRYVVDLVRATRQHPELRLGASPRAAIALLSMARVKAAMSGRDHVLPQDIQALAHTVLLHRVIPHNINASPAATANILHQILVTTPVQI